MFLLVSALVVVAGMGWYFVVALLAARSTRSIRRRGTALRGEVVGVQTRKRGYYGGYLVTPEVSYVLAGKKYRAAVANRSDAPEVGSSIDLIVDPSRPYEPMAAYAGTSVTALAGTGFGLLVGIGLAVLAVHDLHS